VGSVGDNPSSSAVQLLTSGLGGTATLAEMFMFRLLEPWRSSFDILTCCSTTVSFSSIRCAYPYGIPISMINLPHQTKSQAYL